MCICNLIDIPSSYISRAFTVSKCQPGISSVAKLVGFTVFAGYRKPACGTDAAIVQGNYGKRVTLGSIYGTILSVTTTLEHQSFPIKIEHIS